MRLAGLGLLTLAAIATAAPARAATPEAAAAQQLAAAEKAARTTFRAALTAAQLQVNAALGDVELAVTGAESPLEAGNELFAALEAFQRAIFVAGNLASNAQAQAAMAALATLGANLGGIYPEPFYPGLGTPRQGFESAIAKDTAKAYAKLAKRIGKVIARFEAQGFGLNVRLRAPVYTAARTWSETTVDFLLSIPPTVDLAVVWSDLALLEDGQLRAAGTGFQLTGPVETGPIGLLVLAHQGVDVVIERQIPPADGRWSSALEGEALVEGVYVVAASQNLTPGDAFAIGLR
jgi:hypothetical protein